MASFFWCLFSKVCAALDCWGWIERDTKGCTSACACMNQHPWLTDEREAKWSETWGIEHICQKHLSEKLSTVSLPCNAHSFSVVTDCAFWVLFNSPRQPTPTLPLLLSSSSFHGVFPLVSAGGHRCAETWTLLSKEGSPGGRGQKGPGRRKGTVSCEHQHSTVPFLCFLG